MTKCYYCGEPIIRHPRPGAGWIHKSDGSHWRYVRDASGELVRDHCAAPVEEGRNAR